MNRTNLRKVEVKTYKGHYSTQLIAIGYYYGYFHKFTSSEEGEYAVIENEEGEVKIELATRIKFIS